MLHRKEHQVQEADSHRHDTNGPEVNLVAVIGLDSINGFALVLSLCVQNMVVAVDLDLDVTGQTALVVFVHELYLEVFSGLVQ